jgi:hypothetical protein
VWGAELGASLVGDTVTLAFLAALPPRPPSSEPDSPELLIEPQFSVGKKIRPDAPVKDLEVRCDWSGTPTHFGQLSRPVGEVTRSGDPDGEVWQWALRLRRTPQPDASRIDLNVTPAGSSGLDLHGVEAVGPAPAVTGISTTGKAPGVFVETYHALP